MMATTHPAGDLRKVLGVAFGIAVVVGGTIGVGILRTPSSIAALLPNRALILIAWLAAGLYVLMAASCYAELTTMLPRAGGAYNYIQKAFGRYAGFLTGWFDFVINAIAPAYFCIVLGEYTGLLFPALAPYPTATALVFLTLFAALNLPGVKSGSAAQQITSALKVLLFTVLIIGCFASGREVVGLRTATTLAEGGLLLGLLRSLQLIMGTYDGWNAMSFFAEEDDNPGKNVPKSYLLGALTITILYVSINAAILYVLPVEEVASSPLAAGAAAAVAFGAWSTSFITIVALFSLMSILNAYMMIPSRILFGLSRDGFFLKQGALVNKGGTPYVSLLICYVLALLLILLSTFDQLFALGAFLTTIVTGLAFASLVRLRRLEPGLPRPYKAWGYPYSTFITIGVTIALFIGFAISDVTSLLVVLVIIVGSYPAYKAISKRENKPC